MFSVRFLPIVNLLPAPGFSKRLDEFFGKKFAVPVSLAAEYSELIREEAIMAESKDVADVQVKDTADIQIIGAALSGKADVLRTGDREVQDVKRMKKLRIVSPREYWEELTARPGKAPGGRSRCFPFDT